MKSMLAFHFSPEICGLMKWFIDRADERRAVLFWRVCLRGVAIPSVASVFLSRSCGDPRGSTVGGNQFPPPAVTPGDEATIAELLWGLLRVHKWR